MNLSIISDLTTIQENDKIFVYCNQSDEPLFLKVK